MALFIGKKIRRDNAEIHQNGNNEFKDLVVLCSVARLSWGRWARHCGSSSADAYTSPPHCATVISADINIVRRHSTLIRVPWFSVPFTAHLAGDAQSIISAFKSLNDSSTVLDLTPCHNKQCHRPCDLHTHRTLRILPLQGAPIKSINRFRMGMPDRRYPTHGARFRRRSIGRNARGRHNLHDCCKQSYNHFNICYFNALNTTYSVHEKKEKL